MFQSVKNIHLNARRLLHGVCGVCAGLLLLAGNPLAAATFQTHESIRQAAHDFLARHATGVSKDIRINVNDLDPRLRVPACDQALTSFLPPGSDIFTTSTVGVQCKGKKPWTLYVPAQINILENVVITMRPLPRGHQISQQDITTVKRDVGGLHSGFFTDPAKVIGKLIKRSISVNSVLDPNLLQRTLMVRRGEQVIIIAKASGLEVRMMGKALMNGAQGDLIRVRNNTSKQIITGTVTGNGTIDVQL